MVALCHTVWVGLLWGPKNKGGGFPPPNWVAEAWSTLRHPCSIYWLPHRI